MRQKHEDLQKKIGKDQVLLVNSAMEIKGLIHWTDATHLLFGEKAYSFLDRADGAVLRSPSVTINKPLVVCLVKYVRRHRRVFDLEDQVTKNYIRQRDNYTCVYCGQFGNTVDHILPKSRGGDSSFGNLATACKKCNGMKADKTPEEAGLKRPVIKPGAKVEAKLDAIESLFYEVLIEQTQ